MATEKQIAANRRNGKKGGPRTAEGKSISSKNSLKHGLLSATVVLPWEDPNEFEYLRRWVFDDLKPEGAIQEFLADEIAVKMWLLGRKTKVESQILGSDREQMQHRMAWTRWQLLDRYATSLQRGFYRALAEFRKEQNLHKCIDAEATFDDQEELQHNKPAEAVPQFAGGNSIFHGTTPHGTGADRCDESHIVDSCRLNSSRPSQIRPAEHSEATVAVGAGLISKESASLGKGSGVVGHSGSGMRLRDFFPDEELEKIFSNKSHTADASGSVGEQSPAGRESGPAEKENDPAKGPRYSGTELTYGAWTGGKPTG